MQPVDQHDQRHVLGDQGLVARLEHLQLALASGRRDDLAPGGQEQVGPEQLLNREELVRSEDLGDYYRVFSDMRGLNYGKFFEKGEDKISTETDYTSENTHRLSDNELKEMLLKLDYVQAQLAARD